ncbi:UDP-N-acetylmuramate:L-alanyl-gamma-D-glutamyl-meso-diaminopimelate ligase [Oceanisphaera pacifica]|uniref:UDP-N-acetylmuramate--L-alanyl-gamma-D-glutamyl-meso-2,6-diaminoheptandioate ligase n=1 Tax=Oceanisphaera pacifica TaxID=2818389 RepID=A0ABS3NF89_9GAMM|nr:UDP-N-acetylmuramate:L-alanyl-gamma-D-glutamyl-meso-diaminopimelate ligase [Oceanisphaera pacifica]MBO1519249.1 UDP-N-acetylmuramate:L-alanyl-gamma-D-glutamyl-meso-diaminopimelate ligase [Oceanisphaera pacifica]
MHIHILGICGTFMGGLAVLAKQLGYQVTGSDANVYPPMSTQLAEQGIGLIEGYNPAQLDPTPDLVVIGNAMSRGNPCVEAVLNQRIPYTSGPQWLLEHVLQDRWVLAVAGTHGKTTTAGMLAWILEDCGLNPGFLIGGVPGNFDVSARLGDAPFFVIEADEYDSAFFDKRSKFVHYRPSTLILNNLEFDHADIFDDLAAIQRQFHHLLRMVPGHGRVLTPSQTPALNQVLAMGCWSEVEYLGEEGLWQAKALEADGSHFAVLLEGKKVGEVHWGCIGLHNVHNGLMALAAARHAGVPVVEAIKSLCLFVSPKRRMELKGTVNNIKVWDDFAHHPTAIATTLAGLAAQVNTARPAQGGRILAVLEPRSNTMKMGIHQQPLADSLQLADATYLFRPPGLEWDLDAVAKACPAGQVYENMEALIAALVSTAKPYDHILVMSNGGFGGIHQRLLAALTQPVEK